MKNTRLNINNRFMILEFILCGLIIFFNLYARPNVVSGLFTFSFIILAIFFIYTINRSDIKFDLYSCVFGIITISGLGVLLNTFRPAATLNFENLKNYIMFCSTVIFMFLMLNIETDKKTAEKILILNIFISPLYLIGYKFFPQQETYYVDVSLNFSNPNLTGMWILQSLLYLSLAFLILEDRVFKTMSVISFVINIYMLELTGARNCMIAIVLFAVVCLIIFVKQYVKFPNWFIGIMNVVPICFVFLYLGFIDKVVESGIFDFLIGEGKTLTSRVEVWEKVLNEIKDCLLIGSYYTAGGNAHNAHLVILGSFGLLTLLLTIYFNYKTCCILNERCQSKISLYCLAAFFAVIFMGLGEGALYSGAMGIYIMACGYIYMARCYYNDDDLQSEVME